MPHVDELLGPVTFAAAGLVAAIAIAPIATRAPVHAAPARAVAAATAATDARPVVRLPSVEVAARRATELARSGCEGAADERSAIATGATEPHA